MPSALHGDILADRWLELRAAAARADPGEAEPGRPPHCSGCGNWCAPVVWFGEALPEGAMGGAERAAHGAELMLVVGTSGAVWPAAGLATTARRGGASW